MESYLCEDSQMRGCVRKDLKNIKPSMRKEIAFNQASGNCWWIKAWLIANDISRQIQKDRKFHQNF